MTFQITNIKSDNLFIKEDEESLINKEKIPSNDLEIIFENAVQFLDMSEDSNLMCLNKKLNKVIHETRIYQHRFLLNKLNETIGTVFSLEKYQKMNFTFLKMILDEFDTDAYECSSKEMQQFVKNSIEKLHAQLTVVDENEIKIINDKLCKNKIENLNFDLSFSIPIIQALKDPKRIVEIGEQQERPQKKTNNLLVDAAIRLKAVGLENEAKNCLSLTKWTPPGHTVLDYDVCGGTVSVFKGDNINCSLYQFTLAAFYQGQIEKFWDAFELISRDDIKDLVLMDVSKELWSNGQFNEALELLKDIVVIDRKSWIYLFLINNYKDVEVLDKFFLDGVLTLHKANNPHSMTLLKLIIDKFCELHHYEKAIKFSEHLIGEDKSVLDAIRRISVVKLAVKGCYEEAKKEADFIQNSRIQGWALKDLEYIQNKVKKL